MWVVYVVPFSHQLMIFLLFFSAENYMMTSSNGKTLRVTDPLCGEFIGPRVNSPHKGQWRGALMLSLICARINGWVDNGEAGDLIRHRAHYDVTVMILRFVVLSCGMISVTKTKHTYRNSAYILRDKRYVDTRPAYYVLKSRLRQAWYKHSSFSPAIRIYCQFSNIRRTQSPNINVSRLVLQLSLPNPLKPRVKLRMKM